MGSGTIGTIVAVGVMLLAFVVWLHVANVCKDEVDIKAVKKLIINVTIRSIIMVAYFILIYEPFIKTWADGLSQPLLQTVVKSTVPVLLLGSTFFKMIKIFSPKTSMKQLTEEAQHQEQ